MTEHSGELNLSITIGGASFSATGETAVVLDAYSDFKTLLDIVGPAPAAPARPAAPAVSTAADTPPSGAPSAASEPTGSVKSPTSLPLKPYLESLNLRGNRERATAILAWSAESGAQRDFTPAQVLELWKKTPFKAPSSLGNLGRDLRAAVAEGWLDSAGTGRKQTFTINGYGEGIVAGWTKSED